MIAEKPARTSLTARELITQVSPSEKSWLYDGRLYPADSAMFFRTALADAAPGSPLQRLAGAEVERLKKP